MNNNDKVKRAVKLTELLIKRYSLDGWSVGINSSRKELGSCNYGNKTIVLSRFHIIKGSNEQTRDVVLHELGHAIAGFRAGHGKEWMNACKRIGHVNPKQFCRLDYCAYKYVLVGRDGKIIRGWYKKPIKPAFMCQFGKGKIVRVPD